MRRCRLRWTRRLVFSACLIPCLACGASECADSSTAALQLLERMSRTGAMVDHLGMATLQRDGDMRLLQIRRESENQSSTDTITLLTGQSAQVVRARHPESCVHPGHTLLRWRQEEADLCGVAAYYRLTLESGDRVAGRSTQRIIAQPRDLYRYAHLLEIDQQTAQLLKLTTLTGDGRPLEQFQYASLMLSGTLGGPSGSVGHVNVKAPSAIARSHAATNSAEGGGTVRRDAFAPAAVRGWQLAWLPSGFVATEEDLVGARQTYTDGMASFSVFLEEADDSMQLGEGVVREGSTLAYTRGMRLAGSVVLVTVLGEVPVNTARIVADSVRIR